MAGLDIYCQSILSPYSGEIYIINRAHLALFKSFFILYMAGLDIY